MSLVTQKLNADAIRVSILALAMISGVAYASFLARASTCRRVVVRAGRGVGEAAVICLLLSDTRVCKPKPIYSMSSPDWRSCRCISVLAPAFVPYAVYDETSSGNCISGGRLFISTPVVAATCSLNHTSNASRDCENWLRADPKFSLSM